MKRTPSKSLLLLAAILFLHSSTASGAIVLGVGDLLASVSCPNGDTTSALFVHQYSAPSTGVFSSVTIRNDQDIINEAMDFLVMRGPLSSLEVVHRTTLDFDENGAGWISNGDSTQTHLLGDLTVQPGDFFAHWHGSMTGPIPTDTVGTQGGLSIGQINIPSGDLDVGDIYTGGFISGVDRDYMINVSFVAAVPEPSSMLVLAISGTALLFKRRR